MPVPLLQRISFKLARIGVVLAFLLGVLLSSIQIYDDYRHHDEEFNAVIGRILRVAEPPATRAVHTLDNRLAQEVVNGLMQYDYVHQARIVDELGQTLAAQTKEEQPSSTRWITSHIDSPYRTYPLSLTMTSYDVSQAGLLEVVVDVDKALTPFFSRSEKILISGIIRNLILVFLLFIAFRTQLTEPLERIANRLSSINPEDPQNLRLSVPDRHKNDELGMLVETGNNFIESVERRLVELAQAEQFLRDSEIQMRKIIDAVPHLIYAKDKQGRFVFVNRAMAEFYAAETGQLEGHSHEKLHRKLSSVEAIRQDGEDREVIETGKVLFIPEYYLTSAAGDKRIMQSNKIPFPFFGEPCTLVVSVDITERIDAENRIEQLAFNDVVTNLPNRSLFMDRLSVEITRSRTHDQFGALFVIDLDNFKTINDSLGHSVGDELLRHVASKLRACLKDEITLARLGGDEFAVIMPELADNRAMAEKSAQLIAANLLRELANPFHFGGREFIVTASLGMAIYPEGDYAAEEILRYADTALFQAKTAGRNQTMMFAAEMADAVTRRLSMETELRDAVRDQQLVFFYQPQLSVREGRIIGAESLLRWKHPSRGLVSPDEFIPVLESSGLILQAGRLLLTQACLQLREWLDKGLWDASQRLAVNISARQFHQTDFVDQVIEVIEATRVPAACLELELTESIIIQNVKDTIHKMMSLRAIGVRFSLDDFGTGYSSLSYLKRLPVDALKIDRSFVQDITRDPNDAAIVSTIIAMAENLDLEVVAEGVETQEQLQFLEQHRCQYYQGYLFSRPVPAADLEALLREQVQMLGDSQAKV